MSNRDPLAQLSGWFAPLDGQAQPRSTPVQSHLHQQLSPRPHMSRHVDSINHHHHNIDYHEERERPHERSQLMGVGMVFQVLEDKSLCVAQIEPNCSAARCGVIEIDDEVLKIDSNNVEKQPISILKDTVLGKQGTYVTMTFRRESPQGPFVYEIELMRGAAEFLEVVTKCKSMAREQVQLINRLAELEDTVTSQKEEMDKMGEDLRRYHDIMSRTEAMQSSAESSLASAQSEIATAKNEIAYLRSAQRNAEDNGKTALKYAQELESLKAEMEKIESARSKERDTRKALGNELEALQRSYAKATMQKEDAERRLAEALQGTANEEDRHRKHAEIEERFSMLEAGKVVELQQLHSDKADLESQLASANKKVQIAADTVAARYEAELAACRGELAAAKQGDASRSLDIGRKQQQLEEERDRIARQLLREQEERAKLTQQSEQLRQELAEEQRKALHQKSGGETGWMEEKESLQLQMKQLQQELLETASRQRDAEEVKAALEQLRGEAAKRGIEAAVREEELASSLRQADAKGAALEASLEEAKAEAKRIGAGLVEKQSRCLALEEEVHEERAGKELAEKEVEAYKKHLRKVEGELVAARRQSEEQPRQEQAYAAVMVEAEAKVRAQAEQLSEQAQELDDARAELRKAGERASSERQRLQQEAWRAEEQAAEERAAAEAAREEARRVRAELAEERGARERAEEARRGGEAQELEAARAEARRTADRARTAEERVAAVAASAEAAREETRRARAELAEERGARGRAEVEREERGARVEELEGQERARQRAVDSGDAALRLEAEGARAEIAQLKAQLTALHARLNPAPAHTPHTPPAPQMPPKEPLHPQTPDRAPRDVTGRSALALAPPLSPSASSPTSASKLHAAPKSADSESALSHWAPAPSPADRDAARTPAAAETAPVGESGAAAVGQRGGAGVAPSARKSLKLGTGGGGLEGGKEDPAKPKSLRSNYFAQGAQPTTPPPPEPAPAPAGAQPSLQELRAAQFAAAQRALAAVQASAPDAPSSPDVGQRQEGMVTAAAGGTPWPMMRQPEVNGVGDPARDAMKQALGLGDDLEEEEDAAPPLVELPGHGVHHAPFAAAIASAPRPVLAGHTIAPTPPSSGHTADGRGDAKDHDQDPCESFVSKGFRVLGPSDPLDGPFSPARVLLAASPVKSALVGKADARSRSISFDDKANSVLTFFPSVTEVGELAPVPSPAAVATLMVEEDGDSEEGEAEARAEVKQNTTINTGSVFSFC